MKKYWNIFTDRFGNTILHPQFLMKSYTNKWLKYAPKYLKGKLIDIGCGRMQYKSKILKYIDSYTGLDHPKISKLYKKEVRVDIKADAQAIPVKGKSFDSALMLQTLEYMKDPNKAISEISRILRKDGVLILTSPFLYPIHDYPFDRQRFTDTQLRTLLENNKFKIIKIIPQGGFVEFWTQSLLIFLFKTIIDFPKTIIALTIIPLILITITGNIATILLREITNLSGANNGFILNYLVIAKKT